MKEQNGFTLVELMIIIAILGILAAITFPNYINYRTKKMLESRQELSQVYLGYYLKNYESIHSSLDAKTSSYAKEKYDHRIGKQAKLSQPEFSGQDQISQTLSMIYRIQKNILERQRQILVMQESSRLIISGVDEDLRLLELMRMEIEAQ